MCNFLFFFKPYFALASKLSASKASLANRLKKHIKADVYTVCGKATHK